MIESMYKFLEKIGYAHPLHPPWTHIPMGLVIGIFIFVLVAGVLRRPVLPMVAYRRIILLAFIFTFPTILFGYTDWQHFYEGAWLFPIKVKLVLTGVLLIFLSAAFAYTRRVGSETKGTLVIYTLCFVTVATLGYFGGQLTLEGEVPSEALPMKFLAGEKLYMAHCDDCHPGGQGIVNTQPLMKFNTFRDFLRNPKEGMPPFSSDKLSDQQVMHLYHYINGVLAKGVEK
jgi:uncharacterized membrane protein